MLLRHLGLTLGLGETDLRVVDVLLGDGALAKEPLTALVNGPGGIERRFGGLHVELGLLGFLWNRRARSGGVGRISGLIGCLALARSSCEIRVLEFDQQLSGTHLR